MKRNMNTLPLEENRNTYFGSYKISDYEGQRNQFDQEIDNLLNENRGMIIKQVNDPSMFSKTQKNLFERFTH